MSDIFTLPPEIMEEMFKEDKSLMEQYKLDSPSWIDHLKELGMAPMDDVGPERSYPLGQTYSSPHGLYIIQDKIRKYGIEIDKLYKTNRLRYRSDEFTNNHDGKHILFAGCSITFGEGIPEGYYWPKMVYDKIAAQEKTSGYFNIASPGNSILDILNTITEYIYEYGIPDVLFILFPNKQRDPMQFNSEGNATLEEKLYRSTVQVYRLIKDKIESNGGTVISSSWSREASLPSPGYYPLMLIESFVQFKAEDLVRHIYDFCNHSRGHEYGDFLLKAADLAHPGIAEHDFYFNLMYNRYYEEAHKRT